MSERTKLPTADEPRAERCEACRYWEDNDPEQLDKSEDYEGWCRRHAPMPLVVLGCRDEGVASSPVVWPFTEHNDWCGEWKAKGEPVGDSILNAGIGKLDLPNRTLRKFRDDLRIFNGSDFKRYTVETLGDLVALRAIDLLDQNGFGEVRLREVRAALAKHGLKLKGD